MPDNKIEEAEGPEIFLVKLKHIDVSAQPRTDGKHKPFSVPNYRVEDTASHMNSVSRDIMNDRLRDSLASIEEDG